MLNYRVGASAFVGVSPLPAAKSLAPNARRGVCARRCTTTTTSSSSSSSFSSSSTWFTGTRAAPSHRAGRVHSAASSLVAQLQAEPQAGEPGYKKLPDDKDGEGEGESASSGNEPLPEAAKKPVRSPLAASGRPRMVSKSRGKQKQGGVEEDDEDRPPVRAKSFEEFRSSAPATRYAASVQASTGSASGTEKRSAAMQASRSKLDSGSLFKIDKVPEYLQPLAEDTREQREKLRARIFS